MSTPMRTLGRHPAPSTHAVWTNAVSLAARGQAARVDAVRNAVAMTPDLEATGAWIAGTGLASVVPDAQAAASRLL